MNRSRFNEEEIHRTLTRVAGGACVLTLSRNLGVSPQTIYRWRRRYGGAPPTLIRRIKCLEDEVRKLESTVSDLTLERTLLQRVLESENLSPGQRRVEVRSLQTDHGVSERKVCHALGWSRSSVRYESVADGQDELRMRLRQLAVSRPRSGYRTLCQLLRGEGWEVNHKRVYRLYREEDLANPDTRHRLMGKTHLQDTRSRSPQHGSSLAVTGHATRRTGTSG